MSCSEVELSKGIDRLRQALIVLILSLVVVAIEGIIVGYMIAIYAIKGKVLKLNFVAGFAVVTGLITALYNYLVYKGFGKLCTCLKEFFCFARIVYLIMVFVSLGTSIGLAWYVSSVEIELKNIEKIREALQPIDLVDIALSLVWIFAGAVFYKGMRILGEYAEVSRLRDGGLIGYIFLALSFLGTLTKILVFEFAALILGLIAIAMIYSGLGTLKHEKIAELLKHVETSSSRTL